MRAIPTLETAALLLLLLPSLATAQDARQAYVEGLRALQRRDAEGARRLLEEAIRQNPTPERDAALPNGRRADYFPYVHLAQACFVLGDAACARDAVRQSEERGEPPAARLRIAGQLMRQRLDRDVPPGPAPRPPMTAEPGLPPQQAEPPARDADAPLPTPAPTPAPVLEVFSDPPGAEVYVDDEPVGRTDPATGRLVKSGLAAGLHRVRVEAPGRNQARGEIATASAGTSTLRLALPLASPRTPRSASLAFLLLALLGLAALVGWRRRGAAERAPTVVSSPTAIPAPRPGPTVSTRAGTATDLEAIETQARPTRVAASQSRFGPYRLLEQIGRGGMATVFRAAKGSDSVALKRPLGSFVDDPEFLERFLREAEIGRALHHPNIVRIFERGEVEGVPYFTMELVPGETLQERLKRTAGLPPVEAARLVVQVAEALDYAHLKGIVHRDLKPSNIMVLKDGAVKVMDYGIARARRFDGITVTGAFLGTPDYVAPETAEGRGADARSDLYSLGIVLYEALTGKRPFSAESPFVTLRKHCTEPPTPPSAIAPGVPRELEAIVLKLLRKDPAERYASAEELILALREYLARAA